METLWFIISFFVLIAIIFICSIVASLIYHLFDVFNLIPIVIKESKPPWYIKMLIGVVIFLIMAMLIHITDNIKTYIYQ